jgi:creatinine amidohydrolase
MLSRAALTVMLAAATVGSAFAQTNPLWREERIKNFLPHMTWPEVRDLLTRTDMVLIPVPSIEQHGPQTPTGTDYYAGVEQAKLIAQRTDVLVAPVLLVGQSPYHMEFPGTITLSSQTIQQVYFEAAESLIQHGFRRFLFLNSHAGNQYITRFVVDRINQETAAVAVDLGDGIAAMSRSSTSRPPEAPERFDRHGGVGETSRALYLFPTLVQLEKAQHATLTLPPDLSTMLPEVVRGDAAATLVFLAEGLKAKRTGKGTSSAEMSATDVWSERHPGEATVELGRRATESMVEGAVRFVERWKALRGNNLQSR